MKLTRSLLAVALTFSLSLLSFLALPIHTTTAQEINAALQRGYRTGYSDGYMAGYRDVIDSAGKDFSKHQEYADASRAYNKDYGTLEDYRDGYRQGFESGYDTGFEKRSFDSATPTGIKKRGDVMNSPATTPVEAITEPATAPVETSSVPAESSTAPITTQTETIQSPSVEAGI